MPYLVVGWNLLDKGERATDFQSACFNVLKAFEPLPARGRLELLLRDELALQPRLQQRAVLDQDVRVAFEPSGDDGCV